MKRTGRALLIFQNVAEAERAIEKIHKTEIGPRYIEALKVKAFDLQWFFKY